MAPIREATPGARPSCLLSLRPMSGHLSPPRGPGRSMGGRGDQEGCTLFFPTEVPNAVARGTVRNPYLPQRGKCLPRAVMTPTTPFRARCRTVANGAELAPIAFTYISTFAVDAALVQMLPELFDPDFLTPQLVPQLVRLSLRAGA